jgi:uncharacterized protein (TIGR02271 family)
VLAHVFLRLAVINRRDGPAEGAAIQERWKELGHMSSMGDRNREVPGIEAPGPIDRALDRDRDDRIDILEQDQGKKVNGRSAQRTAAAGERAEYIAGQDREVRVPVVEEQLQVGKREVDLGEVEVRRRVVEEEQSVPVTLRREEVTVRQVDTPDRPLRPGEEVFDEGTVRVPVRGEEAVVAKQAVVTGEVVVEKEAKTEERTVSDTVRRTEVDFDEDYDRARTGFERDFATRQAAATDDWGRTRTWAQAEPSYRAGYTAGADRRYAGREFDAAEPDLRRDYESGAWGSARRGDGWERLREEVRHGFQAARGRAR